MITFFDTHGVDHDNNSAFQNLHLVYAINLRLFLRRHAPYNKYVAFEDLSVRIFENCNLSSIGLDVYGK